MTGLQKKILGAVASAAVLLNTAMPIFATTITITGNGAGTDNYVTVDQTTTTAVNQTNTANVTNDVSTSANSGDNKASFNNGDTTIDTGAASTSTNVSTDMNSNTAQVDCCATSGDTTVKVTGNSAYSDNLVTLDQNSTTAVNQTNKANVANKVDSDANSGDNKAESNTGGSTTIMTGKASTDTTISNSGNTNVAVVGSSLPAPTPSATFIISGNGAGADNWISAQLSKTTALNQTNAANVDNYVHAKAESGDNKASFNTGGDNTISTGKAESDVNVDNSVNFNYADINCGCTWNVDAKIAGNSADPFLEFGGPKDANGITLDLGSTQAYNQGNLANLDNVVASGAKANSGDNQLFANTGETTGDPVIMTGAASTGVSVSNSGNVNQIGNFDWSSMMPGDWGNLNFSFNLGAFLAYFGLSL